MDEEQIIVQNVVDTFCTLFQNICLWQNAENELKLSFDLLFISLFSCNYDRRKERSQCLMTFHFYYQNEPSAF